MKRDQAQPATTKLPEITLPDGWLERDIARAQKRMAELTVHQSARDEEVKRALLASNDLAGLMRCRLVPVAWKLRAFGVSEPLIEELCK